MTAGQRGKDDAEGGHDCWGERIRVRGSEGFDCWSRDDLTEWSVSESGVRVPRLSVRIPPRDAACSAPFPTRSKISGTLGNASPSPRPRCWARCCSVTSMPPPSRLPLSSPQGRSGSLPASRSDSLARCWHRWAARALHRHRLSSCPFLGGIAGVAAPGLPNRYAASLGWPSSWTFGSCLGPVASLHRPASSSRSDVETALH